MPKKQKKKEVKPPEYYKAKMIWGGDYGNGVARVRIPETPDPAKKEKALQDMRNLAKLNSSNKYPFY